MRCRVCAHDQRAEIEAAAGANGVNLVELARTSRLSSKALERHMASHPRARVKRAPKATKPSPKPRRPEPERAGIPPAPAVVDELVEEQPPATSRSASRPTTARAELVAILDEMRGLLRQVQDGPSFSDKMSAIRTACTTIRLLANLTGEMGQAETTVASSPHYRRVRNAIIEALRPFPDAARAVLAALEREEAPAPAVETAA